MSYTINETKRIHIAAILAAARNAELSVTVAAKLITAQINEAAHNLPEHEGLHDIAELFDTVATWPDCGHENATSVEQREEFDFALSQLYDYADNVGIRVLATIN